MAGKIIHEENLSEALPSLSVEMGVDCTSPAAHSTFSMPRGLMAFVGQLREFSGRKPVGFKLCMGIAANS